MTGDGAAPRDGVTAAPTAELATERLRLRPYERADEEAFVALFQDDAVARYVGDGKQTEQEDRALFGRVFDKVYPTERFAVWAVERGGAVVGHAEIKPSPSDDVPGWELVYILARSQWGQGIGTELARAVTEYGFALGLPEVWATVDADNAGSIRILDRLGYTLRGERLEDAGRVLLYAIDG
ncbi:GNAT family N-acetyltransferase [Microbacterium sp. Au-Mic1]|uniref:GNAT family N-acetyltransferase n=1 Tax=Microbacterium sp. Au-Mic1 TaxID=2906457 RepID=UPI001E4007BF|nr:GNAT family N-acetyltransferase [Microbacterium sp. Au-Mic1]MCE4026369.1 GNAT family N-acetyltransferase [Microbacterium sp. Au-Mic1]